MPAIATQGLTRTFGPVTALSQLSVEMPSGVVGLVGANGAGKSTLIKILLGLLPPTSGTATILGLDCLTDGLKIREIVGYMPESECLPPDVSATEFLVHMARMSGLPTDVARERTADTLRHVGLYEERYRPIGGYSTGMRQRVKLAQALVHDPKLVLLDEPTNGLDPAGRDEMLGLIQRVSTDFGISVVVTSHLLGELESDLRPPRRRSRRACCSTRRRPRPPPTERFRGARRGHRTRPTRSSRGCRPLGANVAAGGQPQTLCRRGRGRARARRYSQGRWPTSAWASCACSAAATTWRRCS